MISNSADPRLTLTRDDDPDNHGMFDLVTRALDPAWYTWLPGSDEIHVSSALRALLRHDRDTWTTRRAWAVIHPEDRRPLGVARRAFLRSGTNGETFSFRLRAWNGQIRWFHDRIAVDRDASGRVTRLAGVVSDITEEQRLKAEIQHLRARQSASAEVLAAISASFDDVQPVFDLIARRARDLCDAISVAVMEFDGERLHLRVVDGGDPAVAESLRRAYPQPPNPGIISGRTVLSGELVHFRDIETATDLSPFVHGVGYRTAMGVPLLRDGRAVGAVVIARTEAGGFDDGEIALIRSFADQAVIAMASATTLRELRTRSADLAQRNSEFSERIDQQSATIDVLKVMSASPGDPQPVFDLIVARARSFCEADTAGIALAIEGSVHLQTHTGLTRDHAEAYEASFPRPIGMDTLFGRTILAQEVSQIPDNDLDSGFSLSASARSFGVRAHAGVPLMRAGVAIGALVIARQTVGEFSAAQMDLLRTFADQAVIAVTGSETYRALRDRTEALAQRNSEFSEQVAHQAATIDVLKVMSASPGDPQPVFDLIARRAGEVCESPSVAFFEFDGTLAHLRSVYFRETFMPAEALEAYRRQYPMPPNRRFTGLRPILDRQLVHIRDMLAEPGLADAVRDLRIGSQLSVPMVRDGTVIGVISMSRPEKGGYADSQVALLQTFAEQAVIAITSAETYRALQERTEALASRNIEYGERIAQQAATIDVLKVMSDSPSDPRPVFDMITRRACEICNAPGAAFFECDGALVHYSSTYFLEEFMNADAVEVYRRRFPMPPDPGSFTGQAILERRIVHTRDVHAEPNIHHTVRALGHRSNLSVPLLRNGVAIGVISLSGAKPGGFSDSQVELLRIFADQAGIAISTSETNRALRERTEALALRNSEYGERIEHQSATIDVLKAMSGSPDATGAVFDLITRRARELCNGDLVGLFEYDGEWVHRRSSSGIIDPHIHTALNARFPMRLSPETIGCRAILEKHLIHIRDADADPDLSDVVRISGTKSILAVPLLRDGVAIGAISLNGQQAGGFSDGQVELLKTFAEQAVIAIGGVATFRALRERTADLTRSVAELQALEETLRAVNSSLDLNTVLETIIDRAVRLSRSDEGTIYEFDSAEQVFVPKSAFGMSAERLAILRDRRIKLGETHLGRSAMLRAPVAVDDVQQDASIPNAAEALPGIHAVLAVPLLREDTVIGGLVIRRRTEESFSPGLVTLMQTFAGQAVLAIENARLFQELAARGEEAREARIAAETALADLRRTQDRLVQTEKMASLGQLTAGIAHEIKNPLNFVNNFSDLSVDLLDELHAAVAPDKLDLTPVLRAEIDDITATLKGNLEKIVQHGRRADNIVRNMLLHSRSGPAEHRMTDLNATVEEALNLAYHGARAETPGFNITMAKDLDPAVGNVDLFPQEFIRVLVNLINNGFYAAHKRAKENTGIEPTLRVTTSDLGDRVEIRVHDNGTGIPETARDKIFEPFFTTKPAGEGTGLGLSLSHEIVVKQHGGQLTVDSQIGSFTEFTVILPRRVAAGDTT